MLFSNLFGFNLNNSSNKHVSFNPKLILKKFSKMDAPIQLHNSNQINIVLSPINNFAFPTDNGLKRKIRKSPAIRTRNSY
jgi:hypothetical protein